MERRQARIRRIRKNLDEPLVPSQDQSLSCYAALHHHIGLSENLPQQIGSFLRQHWEDPAIDVSCFSGYHLLFF